MHLSSLKKYTKIFALVFLVVIVLVAVLFLGKGSQNIFSRASSCGITRVSSVQVSANSAVISWESTDVSQGLIQYGTTATNLNFSAPEGSSGKTHSVPLTLLTPNTVYYYLVSIGNSKCDSSGASCNTACVPWSFTTAAVTPQQQIVAPLATPTIASVSATITTTISNTASPSASPAGGLSAYCQQVQANIGASSADTRWGVLKQYDVDGNGIINGLDALKCPKTGK